MRMRMRTEFSFFGELSFKYKSKLEKKKANELLLKCFNKLSVCHLVHCQLLLVVYERCLLLKLAFGAINK